MAEPRTTPSRILDAAGRLVRAGGPDRLSMAAVAAEAGVSRPTLYKWFPSKSLLLAAITAAEIERFDTGLRDLCELHRRADARLDAALRYIVTYLDEVSRAGSIHVDPTFALQSMADSFKTHVESVSRVMGEALDLIPAVAKGGLTREEASEMILRVAYSHYLVPDPASDHLIEKLRVFAGLAVRRSSRRVTLRGA